MLQLDSIFCNGKEEGNRNVCCVCGDYNGSNVSCICRSIKKQKKVIKWNQLNITSRGSISSLILSNWELNPNPGPSP